MTILGTPYRPPGLGYVPPTGGGANIAPAVYGAGTWTWTCKSAGVYSFRVWGAGGPGYAANNNVYPGGAGSYSKRTERLAAGQTVQIFVPTVQGKNGSADGPTTVKTPTTTVTCNPGASANRSAANPGTIQAGGTASGGDINLTGGNGGRGNTAPTAGAGKYADTVSTNASDGGSAPGDEVLVGGSGSNLSINTSAGTWTGADGSTPGGGGSAISYYDNNGYTAYANGTGGAALVIVNYEAP